VQGGYGACFCRPGTIFIEHYECRGTRLISGEKLSRLQKVGRRALAQCRDAICLEARNLSWYRVLITCSGAYQDLALFTNLSWVQEQKQKP
jgi:hypothetical protein